MYGHIDSAVIHSQPARWSDALCIMHYPYLSKEAFPPLYPRTHVSAAGLGSHFWHIDKFIWDSFLWIAQRMSHVWSWTTLKVSSTSVAVLLLTRLMKVVPDLWWPLVSLVHVHTVYLHWFNFILLYLILHCFCLYPCTALCDQYLWKILKK